MALTELIDLIDIDPAPSYMSLYEWAIDHGASRKTARIFALLAA